MLKLIFVDGNQRIVYQISLKHFPNDEISNKPELVQMVAFLPEAYTVCLIQPHWISCFVGSVCVFVIRKWLVFIFVNYVY